MKRLVCLGVLSCLLIRMAGAAGTIKSVALPTAEGSVSGAAFSPDIELRSGQEVAHADVLRGEPADLATKAHMVVYSPDGHYLLLATKGSDVLSLIDATTLQPVKQIALHPEADSRTSVEGGHRYFRGVVSLAGSAKANVFGVLTHDELQGNEAFVG